MSPTTTTEPDLLHGTGDLIRTFSQFSEGFEHRHVPWFGNASEIPALTRENVVIPRTGGGIRIRTPDLLTARRIRAISPSWP